MQIREKLFSLFNLYTSNVPPRPHCSSSNNSSSLTEMAAGSSRSSSTYSRDGMDVKVDLLICVGIMFMWLYMHILMIMFSCYLFVIVYSYGCLLMCWHISYVLLSPTLSHSLSLSLIEICDDPVVSHDLIRGYSLLDIHFSERCDTLLVHFSDMWWPSCLFRPIRDSFKFQFGRVSFFKFH